jgi:RimJ/RimL family protein N-acetyltransferase
MIIVQQLTPAHAKAIGIQKAQLSVGVLLETEGYVESLISAGPAYACLADNKVIAMAGVSMFWKGRGHAWATIADNGRPYLKAITKEVLNFLKFTSISRIETSVDCRFEAGHKWAQMLGFEKEGTMRSWGPNGENYDLYSRVK